MQFPANISLFWFLAATALTSQLIANVKSSPICVEADESKKFCGPVLGFTFGNYCQTYPSIQSREVREESGPVMGNQGVSEMCCHKECTLRELMATFCRTPNNSYKPCPRSNHISQDQESNSATVAPATDSEPIQERQKQPNDNAKLSGMAQKSTEVRLHNEIVRERRPARVGKEANSSGSIMFQDFSPHVRKRDEDYYRNYSSNFENGHRPRGKRQKSRNNMSN